MEPAESAIVSVPWPLPKTEPRTRAATRNAATRLSFHLYNTGIDVDNIVRATLAAEDGIETSCA
jgi:hypothetical protein